MTERELWFGTSGPHDAQIVLVGEAWGSEEASAQRPFVGSSGTELNRMLAEAGLRREDILCTNVVAARPQNNEMWRFFHEPREGTALRGLHPTEPVVSELRRLGNQINSFPRRLVIAAGNYPLWALTNCTGTSNGGGEGGGRRLPNGIMNWRGSMWWMLDDPLSNTSAYSKTPLLPIIHPAAILRAWYNRAITVHDLKARVPMALRGDWRHPSEPIILAPPSYTEVINRLSMWLAQAVSGKQVELSVDIETTRQTLITCIGFSDSPSFAMSIPFVKTISSKEFDSYWPIEQEAQILSLLRRVLSHPNVLIEGQNFIYDTQYIQRWMSVTPRLDFDTMLAQNVMFPGTPKSLDYLSSLYCKYHWYWKEDAKDWNVIENLSQLLNYNAWDALRTREIAQSSRTIIKRMGLEEQWTLKMRINDLCLRMMNRGIRFDTARRASVSAELSDSLSKLRQELLYIIPQEMVDEDYTTNMAAFERRRNKNPNTKPYVYWITSDRQTKIVLYEILGMKPIKDRKTGNTSSGKEARNELLKKYPQWRGLLERLGTFESASNTAGVIQSQIDRDGRMRCSYNPGGTETHRLSSSKNAFGGGTNLQNLSKGKED